MTVVQPRARYLDRHCAKRTKQLACSSPMPIAGRTARDISGSRTLITRASRRVQFRLHKVLDQPPYRFRIISSIGSNYAASTSAVPGRSLLSFPMV